MTDLEKLPQDRQKKCLSWGYLTPEMRVCTLTKSVKQLLFVRPA
jgi:hypothetical protein